MTTDFMIYCATPVEHTVHFILIYVDFFYFSFYIFYLYFRLSSGATPIFMIYNTQI
jgi:hypothetical protein